MFSDRVAPISGIHRVPIVPISLFDGELRIFTLWQKRMWTDTTHEPFALNNVASSSHPS